MMPTALARTEVGELKSLNKTFEIKVDIVGTTLSVERSECIPLFFYFCLRAISVDESNK